MITGLRNINSPVAINTPNTEILVCKYHSPLKGTRAPWRSGRFQVRHGESMSLKCFAPKKQRSAQRQTIKTEAGLPDGWPSCKQFERQKE